MENLAEVVFVTTKEGFEKFRTRYLSLLCVEDNRNVINNLLSSVDVKVSSKLNDYVYLKWFSTEWDLSIPEVEIFEEVLSIFIASGNYPFQLIKEYENSKKEERKYKKDEIDILEFANREYLPGMFETVES